MLNRLKAVFRCFQAHDVRYLVIGGIAAILHGVPRATFDLDVLIDATPDNAKRVLSALTDAGLGTATLTTREALLENEITIFKDRVRVDVQTRTPGIEFEAAWNRRVVMDYQGQAFNVICLSDVIASKKAAGRPRDMEDVSLLENRDPDESGA